jgi:KDO2-lipid IV(A) lauroyltransferase
LRGGSHVAMMIDQAPERRSAVVLVPFMGKLAEVDLAPALLAMRARRPLLVAFPLRTRLGHQIELAGLLEPPARPNQSWPKEAMTQATVWLEDLVRREPEQWLWLHRRWKRHSLPVSEPTQELGRLEIPASGSDD